MTPTAPGIYLYAPAIAGAPAVRVEVVEDAGVLCARFVDPDGDIELHEIEGISGTWAPA